MRKVLLAAATVAAVLAAGSLAKRADAMTAVQPSGMLPAIADVAAAEKIHCVPGWRHHTSTRWRYSNGCRRAGVVVAPPLIVAPPVVVVPRRGWCHYGRSTRRSRC